VSSQHVRENPQQPEMVLRHGAVSAFTVDRFMNGSRTNRFQI